MLRNLRKRTATAALPLLMLAAASCGGDDNGPIDPETTGDLRATVTADGSGLADVTVRLFESGGSTATTTQTTGGDGRTTFSDLDPGSYEVEIELPGVGPRAFLMSARAIASICCSPPDSVPAA